MKPLEQSILDTIINNNLVSRENAILVAASGGPDSTALLSVLAKLIPASVNAAVYVNHNLRPRETDGEINGVKQLCRSLNIDFEYCSVDVNRVRISSGESPEACARRLRFEAFDKIAQSRGTDLLAMGHTRDDQVEEVLIRLIRGSGMNGLSGMRLKNNHIIRPLLNNSKQEILEYLETEALPYSTDSSNKSRAYLRNKVRLDLIPLLEQEFNPSIKQNILNSTIILRDEDKYLNEITNRHYEIIVQQRATRSANQYERSFDIEDFQKLPPSIGRRILEKLYWQSHCPPTFQAIEEIMDLVADGRTGTNIHFSKGLRVIRTADAIIFCSRSRDENKRHRLEDHFSGLISIGGTGEYEIPGLGKILCVLESENFEDMEQYVQYIDREQIAFPLTLRAPGPGELFQPLGAPGRKKVSRFFSDKKLPKHLRHSFPVLTSSDNTIIAIPGMTICDTVKISNETTRCLKIFWKQMEGGSTHW